MTIEEKIRHEFYKERFKNQPIKFYPRVPSELMNNDSSDKTPSHLVSSFTYQLLEWLNQPPDV